MPYAFCKISDSVSCERAFAGDPVLEVFVPAFGPVNSFRGLENGSVLFQEGIALTIDRGWLPAIDVLIVKRSLSRSPALGFWSKCKKKSKSKRKELKLASSSTGV